jgi:excisionase family DNA binding protein
MGMSFEELLTPTQVAELLRVSPVTVRHWCLDGKLKYVTTPGGHRRFAYRDIEQYAHEHGVRLPKEGPQDLRVLVVDDNVDLAYFVMELLQSQVPNITVDVAHDGFEAGEKLYTFGPDIVLLDLMMPHLDGFDTCRRIKQNAANRHVRVIAMTGYPSDDNVQRILASGAETCLAKPVRAPTLLAALGIDIEQARNIVTTPA